MKNKYFGSLLFLNSLICFTSFAEPSDGHSTTPANDVTCPTQCTQEPASPEPILSEQKPVQTLFEAVCTSNPTRLRELIAEGQDPTTRLRFGLTYLHMATRFENAEVIEILINAGLSVNVQGGSLDSTPAHSAVRFENLLALQTLVKRGADLNLKNAHQQTPRDLPQAKKPGSLLEYLRTLE